MSDLQVGDTVEVIWRDDDSKEAIGQMCKVTHVDSYERKYKYNLDGPGSVKWKAWSDEELWLINRPKA